MIDWLTEEPGVFIKSVKIIGLVSLPILAYVIIGFFVRKNRLLDKQIEAYEKDIDKK